MPELNNQNLDRKEIPYFIGVNSDVGDHVAKITEPYHVENATSTKLGVIEKRGGYHHLGETLSVTSNHGLRYSEGLNKIYRVSKVSGTFSVYYLNSSLIWTILAGAGTGLSMSDSGVVDFAEAEQNLFFVCGSDVNRYVTSDGTTVASTDSTTVPPYNHLYNSPPAYKINYYKERLYLGDYTLSGGTRQKNGIMFSSPLVGIVGLVDEDHVSPVTTLTVTDTKYIYGTDTLEVYRGTTRITATLGDSTTQFDITNPSGTTFRYTYDGTGTDPEISTYLAVGSELVLAAQNFSAANNGTFTVTAISSTYFDVTNASGVVESNKTIGTGSITINTISVTAKTENKLIIKSFPTAINASDELWVKGTKLGNKLFRWAGDGAAGTSAKEYDTFKLDGPGFDGITIMESVGDVQVMGSKRNMAVWNGYNLQNFNAGIGCVSSQGYVIKDGLLFFVDYRGIAVTDGTSIPKIISMKVNRCFDGATRAGLEASVGSENGDSVYFYIGNVTLYNEDGSTEKTLSDVVIEYNTEQKNWFVHTGIEMQYATSYVTQDGTANYIAFSDTTNDSVYLFPYGTDDEGSEIFFNVTTKNITLGKKRSGSNTISAFEKIVYPKYLLIDSPQGNDIKGFVSLDNDKFYEIKGSARKGCTFLEIPSRTQDGSSARCRNIKVSIRESSTRKCKINRIAILYLNSEEEEQHHA